MTLIRTIKSIFTYLIDTFFLLLIHKNKAETKRNVIIIRLDAIGDFVLWLSAAKAIRNLYPHKKISLISNQAWKSLATLLPYWDEVIPVDRNKLLANPIYRWKILSMLRSKNCETVIQPTFSREFRLGDSLVRATEALIRIGSFGDLSNILPWQKRISDRWYTRLLSASPEYLMELERNAEFVRNLGLHNFTSTIPSLHKIVELSPTYTIKQPYFIIFPGAQWSGRMWPAEKFSELLIKLTDSYKGTVVVCGSSNEWNLCERVIQRSGKKILNLAGKTSLPELVEIIRNANFLVGNETAGVHIAAAVDTPSVCILGGGHYGRFLPYSASDGIHRVPVPVSYHMNCYNCNWRCTQPHKKNEAVPCISQITVNQVFKAVEKIYSETP